MGTDRKSCKLENSHLSHTFIAMYSYQDITVQQEDGFVTVPGCVTPMLSLDAGAAVVALTGSLDGCLSESPSLAASPAHSHDCGTAQVQSAALKEIPGEGGVPAQGDDGPSTHQPASCRALCVGLGGGSLPNFLSYHFPGLHVDAVELDPTVVAAATQCMGFPHSRSGPAAEWMFLTIDRGFWIAQVQNIAIASALDLPN